MARHLLPHLAAFVPLRRAICHNSKNTPNPVTFFLIPLSLEVKHALWEWRHLSGIGWHPWQWKTKSPHVMRLCVILRHSLKVLFLFESAPSMWVKWWRHITLVRQKFWVLEGYKLIRSTLMRCCSDVSKESYSLEWLFIRSAENWFVPQKAVSSSNEQRWSAMRTVECVNSEVTPLRLRIETVFGSWRNRNSC